MLGRQKFKNAMGLLIAGLALMSIAAACDQKKPDLGKRGSDHIQWCTMIPKQENQMEPWTIPVRGKISFRAGNNWVQSADGNWHDLVDVDRYCTTQVTEYQRDHTVLMCQGQPGCPYPNNVQGGE